MKNHFLRHVGTIVSLGGLLLLVFSTDGWAQDFGGLGDQGEVLLGEGWAGFTDFTFLGNALLTLSLATALGAVIAYHPKSRRVLDSLEEAEAPKTCVLYAVIGAIIGIMVLKYGLVVGFIVFGIGGLMRFRTDAGSSVKTGRVIFTTLIGLSCGLGLPHVAVLATAFGFVLIYIQDTHVTYRLSVKGVHSEVLAASAAAYRRHLEAQKCRILHEKKNFQKEQVTFVFQAPHRVNREGLEQALRAAVPEEMSGAIDWEVD